MKKKLFKNYTYEFDKNERKVLTSFCKQAINQMQTDDRFANDISAFNSVIDKLNSGEEQIKLTKGEKTRLALQLRENVKHIEKEMNNSWFLKKWLYRSMYNQYVTILQTHFED